MKKPTMQDIADIVGVSKMTVSYALRHNPRISPKMGEKIRKIAREMNYTVNPLISALASEIRARDSFKSRPLIAFMNVNQGGSSLAQFSETVHIGYLNGARKRCKELGFQLELFEPFVQGLPGKRLAEVLKYRNISAIVTTGSSPYSFPWTDFFGMSIGPQTRNPPYHKITFSHYSAMFELLQKLKIMGYQRIATSLNLSWGVTEYYRAAIALYQQEIPASQRIKSVERNQFGVNKLNFKQWMHTQRPEVFIDTTHSFKQLIEESGFVIPDHLSFVTLSVRTVDQQIAGIYQNSETVGATAVDLLLNEINIGHRGAPEIQNFTLVQGEWRDGVSLRKKLHD